MFCVSHSSYSFHATFYRLVDSRSYGSVLFVGLRRSGIHTSRFVEKAEIVGAKHVIKSLESCLLTHQVINSNTGRSEERRVGKECSW